MHISGFCDWHHTTMHIRELDSSAWPASISCRTLTTRMKKLIPALEKLVQAPFNSLAFQQAKDFWEKKGRAYATGSKGMWEAARDWGYA